MSMDPARWQQLQALFAQALARPAAEREAFVAAACAGDAALADELRALLAADATAAPQDAALHEAIGRAAAQALAQGREALVGRSFGAWRVVAHIADGGMGAVYRAERADGRYDQPAALKLINPALVGPGAAARLAQERQILARLAHPNIARLLDGGETADGLPWLVMEFVDGEPIDAWCRRRGLDTPARLRLFMQVCAAVDYAHRNLVVHRDLKPGNILVDAEGVPRLLDFGIARLIEHDSSLTRSGERLLTPGHASPEQVTGGPVTTASDIYALGVLLYDLLVGQRPFEHSAGTPAALARAIVETDPPRPSDAVTGDSARRQALLQRRGDRLTPERLARELAGDLDNIVLMALRKEPERRYASAQALAEDIARHLAHRPVRARPDTLAYRSAKFWRRHPVAMPASALALLLAVGGSTAFTLRLADERDRALAAEAATRRAAAFTSSLLEGTGATGDAARRVSVRELLDKAAARVDSELAADPAVATRMRLALATAYHSWGLYDEALAQAQAARAETEARGADGDADRGLALLLLGTVTHDLGRLEEQLDWTRQAEALLRRTGPAAEHGRALGDLALSLNSLRRRDEAEPVFREAIAVLRQVHGGDHDDIAWLLNNLAWTLHATGRLDEAAPVYEEALAMQQRLGIAAITRSQTQSNLAGLHLDRGDLDRAEALWRQTLAELEAVFGAGGHAAVARMQELLARVLLDRGRVHEALALTEPALQTTLRLMGEQHRWTAQSLGAHAGALLAAGRVDEAATLARRSLAVRQAVLPAGHLQIAFSLSLLARVAEARGDLAGAERGYREALALIDALTAPDRTTRDRITIALARVLARQGRLDEARDLAQRAAAEAAQRMPATHWERQVVEAELRLAPLTATVRPEDLAQARELSRSLAGRLGPGSPALKTLEAAIAASGG
ncbi:MAG: serine/threonine protein kinase [Rubrivivax sp.]|nr:serine/threonine protein kinase [Rubrivivax sp.]